MPLPRSWRPAMSVRHLLSKRCSRSRSWIRGATSLPAQSWTVLSPALCSSDSSKSIMNAAPRFGRAAPAAPPRPRGGPRPRPAPAGRRPHPPPEPAPAPAQRTGRSAWAPGGSSGPARARPGRPPAAAGPSAPPRRAARSPPPRPNPRATHRPPSPASAVLPSGLALLHDGPQALFSVRRPHQLVQVHVLGVAHGLREGEVQPPYDRPPGQLHDGGARLLEALDEGGGLRLQPVVRADPGHQTQALRLPRGQAGAPHEHLERLLAAHQPGEESGAYGVENSPLDLRMTELGALR